MFCPLTYLFGHSIYFARLHHVNPLCKHKCAFLQMKEAPNQKVQEKKPLLKFKNTKKYMCLERIWRKKCFRACRHRPLLQSVGCTHYEFLLHPLTGCRGGEPTGKFSAIQTHNRPCSGPHPIYPCLSPPQKCN